MNYLSFQRFRELKGCLEEDLRGQKVHHLALASTSSASTCVPHFLANFGRIGDAIKKNKKQQIFIFTRKGMYLTQDRGEIQHEKIYFIYFVQK